MIHRTHQPNSSDLSNASMPEQYRVLPIRVEFLHGSDLEPHALKALSMELLRVYANGFMHSEQALALRQEEFLTDLEVHLRASERILVVRQGDLRGVVCSCIKQCDGSRVYYLGGIILDPELQRQRIGRSLLMQELYDCQVDILAFHTQSRHMHRLGMRCADISLELSQKVAYHMKESHPNIDLETCIDHGRYGGHPLYGDLKRLKEIALPTIDATAGDACFFAGFVKTDNS